MPDRFAQVTKMSLPDSLAQHIRTSIQAGEYRAGERLPPISEMAKRFGVGAPTLREALRKLQTFGMVEIRHGSGVFVGQSADVLVLANPQSPRVITAKLISDVMEARIPLELRAVALAAVQATPVQIEELEQLLESTDSNRDPDHEQVTSNVAFHRQIALASGNTVLTQVLDALRALLTEQQQGLLSAFHDCDRNEHRAILEALRQRSPRLAVERMRAHLNALRDALYGWSLAEEPVRAAS